MRSTLPCRSVDVTLLSRVRATPELGGLLHRRGASLCAGAHPAAARNNANAGSVLTSLASSRKAIRVCSALEEAPPALTTPLMTLRIPYRVNFGEVLRVVGSGDLLGNWAADRGLQLAWTEGDVWTVEVPVSAGHYEFKCVVYNVNSNSVTRWEDGGNRVLNIAEEPGTWDVSCQWGATADMAQAFTPAPPPPPPPAEAPGELEASAADAAAAEGSSPGGASVELLQTFLVLETAAEATQVDEVARAGEAAAGSMPAASEVAATLTGDADAAAGSSGSAVMLLLATCAAGAVAAAALLAPGGLDTSALRGGGGGGASSQVQSQVSSQLAALGAQVSAVQPAVQAQMASVTDGLAALQPMVRSGVSYVQGQATALHSKATAAAADAVAGTVELGSKLAARQG